MSDLSPLDTLIDALARVAVEDYLSAQSTPEHDSNDTRAERMPLQPPADAA